MVSKIWKECRNVSGVTVKRMVTDARLWWWWWQWWSREEWKSSAKNKASGGSQPRQAWKNKHMVFYLIPHGSHCPAISARCRRSLGKSDKKGMLEHGIKDGRENLVLKWRVECPPKGGSPCPRCPPLLFPHLSPPAIAYATEPAPVSNCRTCPERCTAGCGRPCATKKQGMNGNSSFHVHLLSWLLPLEEHLHWASFGLLAKSLFCNLS